MKSSGQWSGRTVRTLHLSSCVGDGTVRTAANVDIEMARLVDAKYVSDYKFRVWFADGFTREIDMDGEG